MTAPDDDPASRYGDAMRRDSVRMRERERRRYSPARVRGAWMWWAVAVGGLVIFIALMWAVMEKTKWTAGDLAQPASESR
ncbi:hypothetical protein [Lysobacter sp. HA35]